MDNQQTLAENCKLATKESITNLSQSLIHVTGEQFSSSEVDDSNTMVDDSQKEMIKTTQSDHTENGELGGSSMDIGKLMNNAAEQEAECGREKLRRHWTEVAGRVFVPERWDHEAFLMDWIDYSSFDALLAPQGVDSARKALAAERKQASSRSHGRVIGVKSFRFKKSLES